MGYILVLNKKEAIQRVILRAKMSTLDRIKTVCMRSYYVGK
jgi:hypothetical protein